MRQHRRVGAWLSAAFVAAIGVIEGLVFAFQGRPWSAAVTCVVLLLIAWVLSPAAFPRSSTRARSDGRHDAEGDDLSQRGVVVYWRPGCMFCIRLRWSLGRLARRAEWVDIWADSGAAAYVRGVNGGNETVPTVVVDGTPHTNPEVALVRRALQRA
jgi:mycoredoxin